MVVVAVVVVSIVVAVIVGHSDVIMKAVLAIQHRCKELQTATATRFSTKAALQKTM